MFKIFRVTGMILFVGSMATLDADHASAAIRMSTSVADFNSNAQGTQTTTEDFDGENDQTVLQTLQGIGFVDIFGETLLIADAQGDALDGTGTSGVESLSNLVQRENPNFFGPPSVAFSEDAAIQITFPEPQSAVGLFVYFDPLNIGNAGTIMFSSISGGEVASMNRFSGGGEQLPQNDQAYFLGLYEDTGLETISTVTLTTQTGTGTMNYNFDHLVGFTVTAVPEPSSMIALACIGGLVATRKRRQTSRAAKR